MSERLTVGDEVRVFDVFDVNGRRTGQQCGDGWPGRVEKVGRTLVHIRYLGRTEVFRLNTQERNDSYRHQWFRTPGQVVRDNRLLAARAVLRAHHVELGYSCELTLEQIEAIAAVLAGKDPGAA